MTNDKLIDKSIDKRKKILESAEYLFAKHGYHATEVEEIAKSAGMAKGTIYNYFKSKENILLSVLESGVQELSIKMAEGIEQIDDTVEKIKKGIQIYVGFFEEHLPLLKIFISEQIQFKMKEGQDFHKRIFAKLTHLEEVITKAVEENKLNKVDPFVAASSLFGMINFTVNRELIMGKKFSAKHTTEQITKIFLEGMLP
jgi:AcrR family transcriptional regulator